MTYNLFVHRLGMYEEMQDSDDIDWLISEASDNGDDFVVTDSKGKFICSNVKPNGWYSDEESEDE